MIWFTSDSHFWHANVIKYCSRPFYSVEVMNETLVANWNSVVKPEDTIIHLGDFSFALRSVELYSERLNGHKKLVPGNHDPIHPCNKIWKKAVKRGEGKQIYKAYTERGWEILPLTSTMKLNGLDEEVVLSHMPYTTIQEKFKEFIPKDEGKWLICGHIHQHWTVSGRQVNVGVDRFNMFPVSEEDVVKLIKAGPQLIHQSHHEGGVE